MSIQDSRTFDARDGGLFQTGRRSGFSLLELMVVVVVIGILSAMAVPSFQRAIEQSRVDVATAQLQAIYAAQRCYRLDHNAFAPSLSSLEAAGLLSAQFEESSGPFSFGMVADEFSFLASANRVGSGVWSGSITIDQNGSLMGTIQLRGVPTVSPGYLFDDELP